MRQEKFRHVDGEELSDPLRSSGGLHEAGRFQRGVAEFLRLPLVLTVLFAVAAVLVSILDADDVDVASARELAGSLVPGKGSVDFISAVATSLLTVTSITFSVLLLAVQQTASSLTAVVFDQFLRRKANQVYFGFFIGVTTFTFITLGLAKDDNPPIYGGVLTLVFVVAALVVLLMLIHATIDQMRPESVVRSIHELALQARERELKLLEQTRTERKSGPGTQERVVRVLDSGYVVTIDIPRLAAIAREAGNEVEVLVEGRLGEYLVFADPLVRMTGVAEDDDSWDERVLTAFGIDDIRDVHVESGYALDQLENIAWSSASSSSQSPQTATAAIRTLSDLLGRWLLRGERDRSHRTEHPEQYPIVYEDGAVNRGLHALATLLVAAAESRQGQTSAELIRSFSRLAPRLHENDRPVFLESLDSALPSVIQQAELPALRSALQELQRALEREGMDASRVADVRGLLAEATSRLLPKPSDEPEAAHPRLAT